jgi:membrane-bound ClpP family serine protease
MGWEWPAILCLVLGLGLVLYEMFTPGFHLPGILGVMALFAAVILRAKTLTDGLITFALLLVLHVVLAFFFWRSLTKGRLSKSVVVLKESIDAQSTDREDLRALIGREGICLTPLRPAGNAEFDGQRVDVVSEGEFLQKGTRVVVMRVQGLRVLVKAVSETD